MDTEKTIVAIELGSSRISGVAGQRQPDGTLKVLAYAWVPSASCIRHGAVYNLDRTANAIADVISRLDGMLSSTISRVFVGYNAKTLRSAICSVERKFDEDTVISQEIIDDMFRECGEEEYPSYVNLLQESQEYVVDSRRTPETDPMGVACRSIKGSYMNVLLGQQVADYMAQCFGMASVQILDGFVTPIAQADAVLSEDDRQQGCALVDYGADTTTVSVYKNGMLRFLRVIPLGSSLITSDLAQVLKIDTDQAEKLKCTYGLCNMNPGIDTTQTVEVAGRSFRLEEIGDIIGARNEEIVRNVIARINDSGYADVLFAGVILTGGGSRLTGLQQVIAKLMPQMRSPRIVTEPAAGVIWVEPSWRKDDGSQLGILSVMAMGNENCCDRPLPKMDILENLTAENVDKVSMNSLFTDDGESAQEVRDKQAEESRRAAVESDPDDDDDDELEDQPKPAAGGKKRFSAFKSIINRLEDMFDDEK